MINHKKYLGFDTSNYTLMDRDYLNETSPWLSEGVSTISNNLVKSNEKIEGLKKYLTVPSLITDVSNINENSLNLIEYDLTEGFEINNYIVLYS